MNCRVDHRWTIRVASWLKWSLIVITCLQAYVQAGVRQDEADDRERLTTERFLQVLLRRPRPGTSLDRVYGFHVRNDSLDGLIEQLKNPADENNRGSGMMVLGLIQLQRGRPAEAVNALIQAEELLPEDAACSYYLGKAHLAVGATEQAAAALERAIARGPARNEALPIFTDLGRIYGRAGQSEKALEVWVKLEALFPGDVRVGGRIASTLADEGNVEEALKRYTTLSETARTQEDKIAFAVQAAEMKRRLGRTDEATGDLEQILGKLRPGSWLYADVRNRIEQGFLKSGNYDALADYYLKQQQAQPDNLELMVRLGSVLVSAGRLEEAQKTLDAASVRAPEDASVRLALIDVLVRRSSYDAAAQQFAELAKQDPGNPDYLLRWGQTLLDDTDRELEERRTAAAGVWLKLTESRRDDAVTLAQVADRLRSIDRSEEALDLYRRAIEVDETAVQYREYLGEYLHELKRQDEAIAVWESIAAGDRRNVDSLIRLAEVFHTFKLTDRSLACWREAAALDLTFRQELRYANQLRTAQQYESALERLDRAQTLAETPDEREQLLKDRITTYADAGTLTDQISLLAEKAEPNAADLRRLALMYQAAGQLTEAARTIAAAVEKTPDDIPVLSVAADILERQNRFADAVVQFQQLAKVDRRFQSNYLEKIAQLQVRMGLVDDAMKTCERLIDANPASTETYQFTARMAFSLGRTEAGAEALRRAMTIARRDNGPRNMLAAQLATEYRTDEAIDLYWQAFELESKTDDRVNVIRRLAPLYERRNLFDDLLKRIEEIGTQDNDFRGTQLMTSAAHEAVEDFGAARRAVDRLLARQPRDVNLLETMVRLCDAADELERAVEFQKRIVTLANTPENRFRLIRLQLDSGVIDVQEALSQQVAVSGDPSRVTAMIQRAALRGDRDTAIALSKEMLKRDDSLWDVRLLLAQLLLFGDAAPDDETQIAASGMPKEFEEAIAECRRVMGLRKDVDSLPPTAAKRAGKPNIPARLQTWTSSGYQIARAYEVGRYRGRYGNSQRGYQLWTAGSLGEAQVVAQTLIAVAMAKHLDDVEFTSWLQDLQNKEATPPEDLQQITSINQLRKTEALAYTLNYLAPPAAAGVPERPSRWAKLNETAGLTWRAYELDPLFGESRVVTLLQGRFQQTVAFRAAKRNQTTGEEPPADLPQPLTDAQIEMMLTCLENTRTRQQAQMQTQALRPGMTVRTLEAAVENELRLAGRAEQAAEYIPDRVTAEDSITDLLAVMSLQLSRGEEELADSIVPLLMASVRRGQATGQTSASLGRSLEGSLASYANTAPEFFGRHKLPLLDAVLASRIHNAAVQAGRRRSSVGSGTISLYYRRSESGGYSSQQFPAPLSVELLSEDLAWEICAASFLNQKDVPAGYVSDAIIAHLQTPLEGATVREQKTRRIAAAFAHWWSDRPQLCFEIISDLAQEFPDDVGIRIEQARLASELGDNRKALNILDSFVPLDSQVLVRREMAAMNLAVRVGDQGRAAQAAERLFGMRIDAATQLALAQQLQLLGMKDKADAVLQRMRGGRRQDEQTLLQIAQTFASAGNEEAAAEVAFSLLKRSARSQYNSDYYRRQAVEILQTANRLEPLIAMAQRRVESAPKSYSARSDLSELYIAAGEAEKAGALWAEVEGVAGNPAQLVSRAKGLHEAKQYEQSLELYMKAFRKQPGLLEQHFYDMRRPVSSGNLYDRMYEELMKIKLQGIRDYRLEELVTMSRTSELSDAKRAFINKILKQQGLGRAMTAILRSIPKEQRNSFPELRQSLVREATSAAAFSPQAALWNISSYSSNGTVDGNLQPIIEAIAADEESVKAFRAAAQESRKVKERQSLATILDSLLTLQAGTREEKNEAAENLLEFMNGLEVMPPSDLLWQAGLLVEATEGLTNSDLLQLSLYEAASQSRVDRNQDPRYSVDARLMVLYRRLGRSQDARKRLLDSYRKIDFSETGRMNPGYDDYQELQAWQWLADQLFASGYPIEALGIYNRAIADPGKFERAARWGRPSDAPFKAGVKKARAKITPELSAIWLEEQVSACEQRARKNEDESPETKSPPLTFPLLNLPLSVFQEESTQPALCLAVAAMASDDEQTQKLDEIQQRLQTLASQERADWSVAAAQIVVSAFCQPDQAAALCGRLLDRLPDPTSIDNTFRQVPREDVNQLMSAYVILEAFRMAEAEMDATKTERFKQLVARAAEASGETEGRLLVELRFGDSATSRERYLSSIEETTAAAAPSPDTVTTLLRMSLADMKDGNAQRASRALRLALRWGPPLAAINSGKGDAFAIQQRRTSSSQVPAEDAQLVTTRAKVLEFVAAAAPLLDASEPEAPGAEERRLRDLAAVHDALMAVVFPPKRTDLLTLYEKRVAPRENYYSRSTTPLELTSAARTLAEVSVALNREEDVRQRLAEITDRRPQVMTVKLHLARAAADADQLTRGLEEFQDAMSGSLPTAEMEAPLPSGGITVNQNVRNQTAQIADQVDRVLHAVWPRKAIDSTANPKLMALRTELLKRTVALVASERYSAQRLRSLVDVVHTDILRESVRSGDRPLCEKVVETSCALIAANYPDRPDRVAQTQLTQLGQFLRRMQAESGVAMADSLIRRMLECQQNVKAHMHDGTMASTLLACCQLPDQQQYELLTRILLGTDDQADVLHGFGLVRYSQIPEFLQHLFPDYSHLEKVSTSGATQMTDFMLQLAVVAARTGHSEQLAEQLQTRSKEKFDTAWLGAVLVQLVATEQSYDEVAEALTALRAHLKEAEPTEFDRERPYPGLETILLTEAMVRGMPVADTEQTLSLLLTYGRQSEKNPAVSMLGSAAARMGLGKVAHGTAQSPLAHLVAVSFAWPNDPHPVNNAAQHSYGDEWVSSTGGFHVNSLMLPFPITGEFEVSAVIMDDNYGEGALTYSATAYQPGGWNKKADMNLLRGNNSAQVPVENIALHQPNLHGLAVTTEQVIAQCNEQDYFTDKPDPGFPWLGVVQNEYRTTRWKDLKISGSPIIPREVSLISPYMRGWCTSYSYLRTQLPSSGLESPETAQMTAAPYGKWDVDDQQVLTIQLSAERGDPGSFIMYQRPVLEGERVTMEFWWESGVTEIAPLIGNVRLNFEQEGVKAMFQSASINDLAKARTLIRTEEDPGYPLVAPDVTPRNKSWNTIVLSRTGDVMTATLNDEPVYSWEVCDSNAHFALSRDAQMLTKIRRITLSGDWPTEVPDNLMERAAAE